jgi:hypothetical protein
MNTFSSNMANVGIKKSVFSFLFQKLYLTLVKTKKFVKKSFNQKTALQIEMFPRKFVFLGQNFFLGVSRAHVQQMFRIAINKLSNISLLIVSPR